MEKPPVNSWAMQPSIPSSLAPFIMTVVLREDLDMSFGFSLSDVFAITALTKQTYDRWQQAPGEYEDVVQTLQQRGMLMQHIHYRFDALAVSCAGPVSRHEMDISLQGCKSAVQDLLSIAEVRQKQTH